MQFQTFDLMKTASSPETGRSRKMSAFDVLTGANSALETGFKDMFANTATANDSKPTVSQGATLGSSRDQPLQAKHECQVSETRTMRIQSDSEIVRDTAIQALVSGEGLAVRSKIQVEQVDDQTTPSESSETPFEPVTHTVAAAVPGLHIMMRADKAATDVSEEECSATGLASEDWDRTRAYWRPDNSPLSVGALLGEADIDMGSEQRAVLSHEVVPPSVVMTERHATEGVEAVSKDNVWKIFEITSSKDQVIAMASDVTTQALATEIDVDDSATDVTRGDRGPKLQEADTLFVPITGLRAKSHYEAVGTSAMAVRPSGDLVEYGNVAYAAQSDSRVPADLETSVATASQKTSAPLDQTQTLAAGLTDEVSLVPHLPLGRSEARPETQEGAVSEVSSDMTAEAGTSELADFSVPKPAQNAAVSAAPLTSIEFQGSTMGETDQLQLRDDVGPATHVVSGTGTVREQITATGVANRIELPTHMASQIADAARQLPDRPVEITLSPEELGKVRLSFHLSENGAMHVVIAAERADTLDLLRRNVDSLIGEFRDLGYTDSGFSFQNFDQGTQQGGTDAFGSLSGSSASSDMIDPMPTDAPVRLSLGNSSGMDIRL
ncbi:flagellar hook-length control protein FliK [Celeribacter persicus]|uniref:Flagellar hook-length control protein FliK n=2 Tax=Celeribacter persicus TaxID=1651082 RepID=A0A2T5HTU9_9RHOB|nr:flagellar hook-length control protein FliK [Celeribacter persicus]